MVMLMKLPGGKVLTLTRHIRVLIGILGWEGKSALEVRIQFGFQIKRGSRGNYGRF